MQASIPEDKISSLEDQLNFLLSKHKASRQDLQRVAGFMNFLAKVVKGGRTFLRRVLDCMNSLKRPFYKARITSDLRKDFWWWLDFCRVFNGQAISISYSPIIEHAYTYASLSGFGAHCRNHWLAGVWFSDKQVQPSLRLSGNWIHTTTTKSRRTSRRTLTILNCMRRYKQSVGGLRIGRTVTFVYTRIIHRPCLS